MKVTIKFNRMVIILSIIIVLALMIIWKLSSGIGFKGSFAGSLTNTGMRQQAYQSNVVGMEKSKLDGNYFIKLKNVVGTAGDKTHYNVDITLETDSYQIAKLMSNNREKTLAALNVAMSTLSKTELASQQGRELLKSVVKQGLSDAYGVDKINEVYLEKYLYQN